MERKSPINRSIGIPVEIMKLAFATEGIGVNFTMILRSVCLRMCVSIVSMMRREFQSVVII